MAAATTKDTQRSARGDETSGKVGTQPPPGLVRFGLFADAHYADKVHGSRHYRDSAGKLRLCVNTFAQEGLDFAVCMGDLIDSAEDRVAEIGYVRTMVDCFERFSGPRHWVLGNHDLSAFTKEEFLNYCGANRPAHYSFDVNFVHFVVLDANHHADGRDFSAGDFAWNNAWIGDAQIEWLTGDLKACGDRPAVVLCHENLDHRLSQGSLDPHVVCDADRVRQVLEAAGNVRAVIQAHYHAGLQVVQQGIPYLSLRAMVVGPGLENNAYAIATVHPGGRIELQGFGCQAGYGREAVDA